MKIKWHKLAQKAIFHRVQLYHNNPQNHEYLEELFTIGLLPEDVPGPFEITKLNSRLLPRSVSDCQGSSANRLNLIDIHLELLDILDTIRDPHQSLQGLQKLGTLPIGLRYQLAQNTSTPVKIQRALLQDKIIEVRLASARSLLSQTEGFAIVQNHYLKTAPPAIGVVILLHSKTPPQFLTQMAKNFASDWLVRYAIARHRNTPRQVRHALANDTHHLVRSIARARYQQEELARQVDPTEVSQRA
ncbi:MAG: hypothetical protein ACP5D7_00755 [Limnospira sp.]